MKKIPAITALGLILTMAAGNVGAGHGHHNGWGPRHADRYGKVIQVKPIIDTVAVSTPEAHCSDGQLTHTVGKPAGAELAGAVVGGVVGGVVGNQFGKGNGRSVMTVAGIVIGATIGFQAGPDVASLSPDVQWSYRHCETLDRTESREELVGYRVKYLYRGHVYRTRTDDHPGKRIRVDRSAHPIRF
jgi:uncharacterized protein YcfJ